MRFNKILFLFLFLFINSFAQETAIKSLKIKSLDTNSVNKETFNLACENSKGAIIGSAYINNLKINGISGTKSFIQKLTN